MEPPGEATSAHLRRGALATGAEGAGESLWLRPITMVFLLGAALQHGLQFTHVHSPSSTKVEFCKSSSMQSLCLFFASHQEFLGSVITRHLGPAGAASSPVCPTTKASLSGVLGRATCAAPTTRGAGGGRGGAWGEGEEWVW